MFKILRLITIVKTKLFAKLVGIDNFGNLYFEHNTQKTSVGKKKRFCIYNGTSESSRVPAVFHSWLHYSHDDKIFTKISVAKRTYNKYDRHKFCNHSTKSSKTTALFILETFCCGKT